MMSSTSRRPGARVSLREELQRRAGFDIEGCDDEELQRRAAALRVDTGIRESRGRIIDKLMSSLVEPHLVQPTFLLDYPEEMSPLAKGKPDAPGYVRALRGFRLRHGDCQLLHRAERPAGGNGSASRARKKSGGSTRTRKWTASTRTS